VNLLHQKKGRRNELGQLLPMFAAVLPILLLFLGFVFDFGYAFFTKETLSKAVDAAALAGMRNYSQGQSQAQAIALSAFNANYASAAFRDYNPPVVNIAVTTDASNNKLVSVNATVAINTFFIRLLPAFKTLTISSSAQVTRPMLIMSLVLDKSGSMNLNGGAQALPPAVVNFVDYFDDNSDRVAMVSFSSIATVNVNIGTNFQSVIASQVNSMAFGGATFSQAGLLAGQGQINSVAVKPGENVVKVVVFFTDGWANTIQDNLSCPASTLLNYGGCAPPESAIGWCGNPPSNIFWMNPSTGQTYQNSYCNATSFPSQQYGNEALTQLNVANDSMYRSVQVANSMRAQNIVVYSIGLGDKISEAFLQQVANDPASTTYDASQPVGEAVFAPTPADLQSVFQIIASKILTRISQ
jgi:Flp pilus assembly protein TadG